MVDRHVDIRGPQENDIWSNIWNPFRQMGQQVADWFAPTSEASGEDGKYTVRVELPGVKQDDIDIAVRDDMLVVTGEKREDRKEEGESYFFSERRYGAFRRAVPPAAGREPGRHRREFRGRRPDRDPAARHERRRQGAQDQHRLRVAAKPPSARPASTHR